MDVYIHAIDMYIVNNSVIVVIYSYIFLFYVTFTYEGFQN